MKNYIKIAKKPIKKIANNNLKNDEKSAISSYNPRLNQHLLLQCA